MKSERVTQAWEFYRDNCQGFKEPMRREFRKLDEYVSSIETENAKLKRAAERDADVMESLNLSLEESQAENAKLRELCEDMLSCIEIREAFCRPPTAEMCKGFADRAHELGIEVEDD